MGAIMKASCWMAKILCLSMFLFPNLALAGTLGDVTGNGNVGLPEAIHALQVATGSQATFSTASEITIFSKYVEFSNFLNTEGPRILMTVPSDKTFVLRSIYGHFGYWMFLREGETTKVKFGLSYDGTSSLFALHPGIPFAPGATINYIPEGRDTGFFTISGYFIQNVITSE